MLPVLLARPPLVPGSEKPKDERVALPQWQAGVRRLMRGVVRSDNKAYPLLDPKEFAPPNEEFACLLEQPQRPLFTVESGRILWDIRLRSCSSYLAEVTREMSLANNHFAAIGPLLNRPLAQADAWRNRSMAMNLFAVLFHKVQVLRELMRKPLAVVENRCAPLCFVRGAVAEPPRRSDPPEGLVRLLQSGGPPTTAFRSLSLE
jgi:hypothetical protein